jgi:hypothetical protein
MDYICPEFDHTATLFTSPVESPVPYGTSLDLWADCPANSDTNTPDKEQHPDIIYHGKF